MTKDGVTVAEDIELDDSFENLAAQLVKEAASKQMTLPAMEPQLQLFFQKQFSGRTKNDQAAAPMQWALARGIHKAVEAVTKSILSLASSINEKNKKELMQIATIAGNNDPTIGNVLAEAILKVGKDGVITVEEGKQAETFVNVVEGNAVRSWVSLTPFCY